ncbi:hypothetical protein MTO96_018395 [Rhipicephalus appendiculatus]
MVHRVAGEDITPEEMTEDRGWQSAGARRVGARSAGANPNGATPNGTKTNTSEAPQGRKGANNIKSRILRAGRMPQLPWDDTKIVIRPRGGLNIAKTGSTVVADAFLAVTGICTADQQINTLCPNVQQNIMVASTPSRDNADRYVRVRQIIVLGRTLEVSAYKAVSHSTCKGVIRGIPLVIGPDVIDNKIVNDRNPLALVASALAALARLSSPSTVTGPGDVVCRGCGASNPDSQHQWAPKCRLCGGQHLTADKDCSQRFKIPYVVRRRRWEKSHATD